MPPKAKAQVISAAAAELSTDEKINHIFNTVNKIDATLGEQQVRVAKLESDVVVLNKEVAELKNIVNTHEQRSRSSIIRISGFPLTEDEKQIKSSSALSRLQQGVRQDPRAHPQPGGK